MADLAVLFEDGMRLRNRSIGKDFIEWANSSYERDNRHSGHNGCDPSQLAPQIVKLIWLGKITQIQALSGALSINHSRFVRYGFFFFRHISTVTKPLRGQKSKPEMPWIAAREYITSHAINDAVLLGHLTGGALRRWTPNRLEQSGQPLA